MFGEEQAASEAGAKYEGLQCLSKGFEIIQWDTSKGHSRTIAGWDLRVRSPTLPGGRRRQGSWGHFLGPGT